MNIRKYFVVSLLFMCLVGCQNSNNISNNSDPKPVKENNTLKEDAMKAYKEYLSQNSIVWHESDVEVSGESLEYKFIDLNNDDIDEMIVYCPSAAHTEGWYSIFAYYNNELKELSIESIDEVRIGEQPYVKTQSMWQGDGIITFYVLENGEFKNIMSYNVIPSDLFQNGSNAHEEDDEIYYDLKIDNQNVDYYVFMETEKEMRKNTKEVSFPMY